MDRRKFIKAIGIAGGSAFVSHFLPIGTAHASVTSTSHAGTDPLLDGVCDIHIHATPDVKGRTVDELGLSRRARDAGYKAVLFKSNVWSCHDRASLVQQALPGFDCYGSLVMNLSFGDKVNVYAVEQALKTSGNLCRCIWMPTQNAAYPPTVEAGHAGETIPVADASGNVLPEVIRVMELCAESDIIFATGHSSPEESLTMARKAKEIGMRKFVITHANSRIWRLSHDQIRQAVDLGAWIEYCYLPRLWGPGTGLPNMERQTAEEFARYVRLFPERSFVSTDLGSAGMPEPIAGMRQCIEEMTASGISQGVIDQQVRTNPARLLGLE
ncbi:MAG: DUF6282 family protein [Prevotella sp.]